MPVSAAYFTVVLIWSTTPLGIVWSSESVSPTMAVLLRMLIAVVIGVVLIFLTQIELPWHKQARKIYAYSAIGIFGGMMCSYFSAAYISSGMMSLVFGLAPILSGVMAQKILNEASFGKTRIIAMIVALTGLGLVCSANFSYGSDFYLGLMFICSAVFFFSLSSVLVKSVQVTIHPVATTVGALIVCMPFFVFTWFIVDGNLLVTSWQPRSIWAIIYLGVFGSLIGFIAYYFVLQKLSASTVTLITMITPIIAIVLGALLNNEPVSIEIILGAGLIMVGLWIYHFGHQIISKRQLRLSAYKK